MYEDSIISLFYTRTPHGCHDLIGWLSDTETAATPINTYLTLACNANTALLPWLRYLTICSAAKLSRTRRPIATRVHYCGSASLEPSLFGLGLSSAIPVIWSVMNIKVHHVMFVYSCGFIAFSKATDQGRAGFRSAQSKSRMKSRCRVRIESTLGE